MKKLTHNNFCVVGLGRHSLKKLIPAINLSHGNLIAVVTSKKIHLKNAQVFKNLKLALKHLDKSTIIVLCSPPDIRANQIILCVKSSFSVISEKPILLTNKKLDLTYKLLNEKKLFLFENYMYMYSNSFEKFHSFFLRNQKKIKKIKINFTIPNFPKNTFRSKNEIKWNIISDIACYPISLINFLKFQINTIETRIISRPKKNLKIMMSTKNLVFDISVGLGTNYKNYLFIYLNSNKYDLVKFNYFFYGNDKKKKVTFYNHNKKINEHIYHDINSFVKIFNFSSIELYKLRNKYSYSKKNINLINKIYNLVNSSY